MEITKRSVLFSLSVQYTIDWFLRSLIFPTNMTKKGNQKNFLMYFKLKIKTVNGIGDIGL